MRYYRPEISDDLTLRLQYLISEHLRQNTDNVLEAFLDRLEERVKVIRFTQWEQEQELNRLAAKERETALAEQPKPVERAVPPELLAQVERDNQLRQAIAPDVAPNEDSNTDSDD